jgi:hypothetical protein
MKFTPQSLGEFDLTAGIDARPDETVKDNNSRTQRLKVIDAKIKVLLMDQSPRWEFRYLQAMLLRDRRVDLKCFLVEGDKGISRTAQTPYLPEFPTRRDELFKFDLVILGDVDPKVLSTQHQENLNKLVSDFGGGLLVLAGKRYMPGAYRRSVLDRILPVEFEAQTLGSNQIRLRTSRLLQLTAAGRASAMLRLSDKEEENAQLWGQLPPIYWVARVSRPAGSRGVARGSRPGEGVTFRQDAGTCCAAIWFGPGDVRGTDNTWRWRKNAGTSSIPSFGARFPSVFPSSDCSVCRNAPSSTPTNRTTSPETG